MSIWKIALYPGNPSPLILKIGEITIDRIRETYYHQVSE